MTEGFAVDHGRATLMRDVGSPLAAHPTPPPLNVLAGLPLPASFATPPRECYEFRDRGRRATQNSRSVFGLRKAMT